MRGVWGRWTDWLLLGGAVAGLGIAVARAGTAGVPADVPHYVRFDPLFIPIYGDGRPEGVLAMRVAIQTTDDATRARLERLRPRLVDAFRAHLTEHARLHVDPDRPVDVRRLSAALQRAALRTPDEQKMQVLVLEAVAKRI